MSWWKSTRQVKALAGRAPVSGSLAVPAKLITSPPAYSVFAGGAVMVTVGGMFAVTVKRRRVAGRRAEGVA